MNHLRALLMPLLIGVPEIAAGQARPAPTTVPALQAAALSAADKQAVVAALSDALRERYVFPETGEKAATALQTALGKGDYAVVQDAGAFAERLTAELSAVAHDTHMRVRSLTTPPRGAMAARPRGEGGIFRADRMAGGVGYIEVLGFPPLPMFKRSLDRAMAALSGSRALIVDVRRNGGGSPESVAYLVSYLVAPDRPINTIVSRTANTRDFTREDFASVPTPVSFATAPVVVLTSKDTFSGGEEFAYDIQSLKRGTLIGEVTGGGANPVDMTELGHGMVAMIPFGRAENPVTKTNWEGSGVRPDIAVPAADALRVALAKAGGGSPVSDVATASLEQVFAPRTTPLAGSEAALRRLVDGYARGAPDYAIRTPNVAAATREQLPELAEQFAALGTLEAVTFKGPDPVGGDEYRLHFARGDVTMALVIGPQGKVAAVSTPMPNPPTAPVAAPVTAP